MRLVVGVFLLFLFPSLCAAQGLPARSLDSGAWEFGAFVGGGSGLFRSSDTQFFVAGGRIGRVLTRDHLIGWLHGNFEYAADILPVSLVIQPGQTVYGASVKPIILKWNFTANSRFAPYMLLSGGGLMTSSDVPSNKTSSFNFVAGGSIGVHIFNRPRRALTLEAQWVHISNADLGARNPQLVANFLFTIGYSWFK